MADLNEIDSRYAKRQRAYGLILERVQAYEADMSEFPPEEDLVARLRDANDQLKKAGAELNAAKSVYRKLDDDYKQKDAVAKKLQGKLSSLQDAGAQRRNRVFRQFPHLAKISDWLDHHRDKFRKAVYGPIAAEGETISLFFSFFSFRNSCAPRRLNHSLSLSLSAYPIPS